MKKAILCLLVFANLFVNAQKGTTDRYFTAFLEEPAVAEMLSNPALPANLVSLIDLSKSYVRTQGEEKKPMGYIPVYENEKLLGVIHFGKVDQSKFKTVNGSAYVIVWRDYRSVKTERGVLNGTIQLYDLNYGGLNFQKVEVVNSVATQWTDIDTEAARKHVCDLNGNGNVGYLECYRCIKNACAGSPECDFLCDMTNLAFGWCNTSIAVSCIYLAAVY